MFPVPVDGLPTGWPARSYSVYPEEGRQDCPSSYFLHCGKLMGLRVARAAPLHVPSTSGWLWIVLLFQWFFAWGWLGGLHLFIFPVICVGCPDCSSSSLSFPEKEVTMLPPHPSWATRTWSFFWFLVHPGQVIFVTSFLSLPCAMLFLLFGGELVLHSCHQAQSLGLWVLHPPVPECQIWLDGLLHRLFCDEEDHFSS